jgi:hypothetical protein
MSMTQHPDASDKRVSVFARGESALAHAVYGLILTMATLGELLDHDVSARTSVAWLLGSGVVLLAAPGRLGHRYRCRSAQQNSRDLGREHDKAFMPGASVG